MRARTRLSPSKPVFPGYVIVLGSVLTTLFTFNGHTFGLAWFLPGIREELDLNAREVGLVWSLSVFFAALGTPFFGKWFVDHPKIGPRRCLACVGFVFGAAVCLMGLVRTTAQLVATITFMRFFGPAAVMITTSKATNTWFRRKRGRIAVVLVSGFHLMQLFPLFVSPAIKAVGWRTAYAWCGLGGGLGISLFGALCFWDGGPAENGWRQDGDLPEPHVDDEGQLATKSRKLASPAAAAMANVKKPAAESYIPDEKESTTTAEPAASESPDPESQAEAKRASAERPHRAEDDGERDCTEETSKTLAEALRTPDFYVFALSIVVVELLFTGALYNFVNLFEADLSEAEIFSLYGVLTVFIPAFAVVTGVWVEFAGKKRRRAAEVEKPNGNATLRPRPDNNAHYYAIVLVQMLLQMVACALLAIQSGPGVRPASRFPLAVAFSGALAATLGIQDVLSIAGVLFADLFGSKHLGAIQGVITCMMTVCTALGPLLFGVCVEARAGPEGQGDDGVALRTLLFSLAGAAGLAATALAVMLMRSANAGRSRLALQIGAADVQRGDDSGGGVERTTSGRVIGVT